MPRAAEAKAEAEAEAVGHAKHSPNLLVRVCNGSVQLLLSTLLVVLSALFILVVVSLLRPTPALPSAAPAPAYPAVPRVFTDAELSAEDGRCRLRSISVAASKLTFSAIECKHQVFRYVVPLLFNSIDGICFGSHVSFILLPVLCAAHCHQSGSACGAVFARLPRQSPHLQRADAACERRRV